MTANVADETLAKIARQYKDLLRRLDKGTLNPENAVFGLQQVIEGRTFVTLENWPNALQNLKLDELIQLKGGTDIVLEVKEDIESEVDQEEPIYRVYVVFNDKVKIEFDQVMRSGDIPIGWLEIGAIDTIIGRTDFCQPVSSLLNHVAKLELLLSSSQIEFTLYISRSFIMTAKSQMDELEDYVEII